MNDMTDQARLQALVADAVAMDPDVEVGPDTDLAAAGLTSLGIVSVVTGIETEFGVTLPYDELDFGWFTTPRELWTHLQPTIAAAEEDRHGRG